jgi:hypothetical protein
MRIECRCRSKWISGIILGLLCCGMLFGEIHGILGHTHSISSRATNPFVCNTPPSGPQLISSENGQDNDPSCSLCYLYRLLGQTLLPQTDCLFDSPFAVQAVVIRHLSLVRTSTFTEGNRSPPQA